MGTSPFSLLFPKDEMGVLIFVANHPLKEKGSNSIRSKPVAVDRAQNQFAMPC